MGKKSETLTCSECSKQKLPVKSFPRDQIIELNGRKLCPQHYKEAVATAKFNMFVCELFGIKSAGPLIYTQRKKLHEQGYTDETIMHTLEYIFRVKKMNKSFESLGLVPKMVDEAYEYHLSQKGKTVELQENKVVEHVVSIKKPEKKKDLISFDFLNDEE